MVRMTISIPAVKPRNMEAMAVRTSKFRVRVVEDKKRKAKSGHRKHKTKFA